MLIWLGMPYVAEGGSPLLKLHPASWLGFAAFVAKVWGRGDLPGALLGRRSEDQLLAGYLLCLTFCIASELLLTGLGNLVVMLDTFLPAACLVLVLSNSEKHERFDLRRILRFVLLINAGIAIMECFCQTTFIPIPPGAASDISGLGEFRPFALFDHPLTGATAMIIGLLLPPEPGWSPLQTFAYVAFLALGLLAFGERSAIFVASGIACAAFIHASIVHVLLRRSLAKAMVVAACVLVMVSIGLVVAHVAGLGERLGGHLYWDDSARVRLLQWNVLGFMNPQHIIFGMPRQHALAMLEPMRMRFNVPTLENSWLLLFMSLGIFAFTVFACGFAALLIWVARRSGGRGVALAVTVLAAASASNGLGRKSTILIIFVAAGASLPDRPLRLWPVRPHFRQTHGQFPPHIVVE